MQHRTPRSKPRCRPFRRMRHRQHHPARPNRHNHPAAHFQPSPAHPHAAQQQRRNTQLFPLRPRTPVIQRTDLQADRPDPMQSVSSRRFSRRNNPGNMHMPPPTEDVPRRDGEGVGRLKSVRMIRSDVFPKRVLYFATLPTQNVQACTQPRRFQSPEHTMTDAENEGKSFVPKDTRSSIDSVYAATQSTPLRITTDSYSKALRACSIAGVDDAGITIASPQTSQVPTNRSWTTPRPSRNGTSLHMKVAVTLPSR